MQRVLAAIQQFAQQQPDSIAVAEYDSSLSYAALNNCADALTGILLEGNGNRDSVVGYLGFVETNLVISLLAAHKAGIPFVYLDAGLPQAALLDIIKQSGINKLVTSSNHQACAEQLPLVSDVKVIVVDDVRQNAGDNHPFTKRVVDENEISHIRYTSGSTGKPKGVALTRRHVERMLAVFDEVIEPRATDRFGLFGHFWPLVIFRVLSVGACLDCFDFPRKGAIELNAWMIERRISAMFTYPVLFRQMMSASSAALPDLRFVHLSGEPVLREDVIHFESRCAEHSCLHNSYGSSEYPWIAGYFHQHGNFLKNDVVPLDKPVAPAMVYLLDEQGQPVATNEVGEIVVDSAYLPAGYYKDPDRSAKVFRPASAIGGKICYHTGDLGYFDDNGLLHGTGRCDQQLKIRGYNVNPGDIEQTLYCHSAIKSVAVVPFLGAQRDDRLSCHFTTHNNKPIPTSALREFLIDRLPRQFLPTVFQQHDALPLTITGKLDRRALASSLPAASTDSPVDGIDKMERKLIHIWTELLGHNNFDRYDDFYSVGGDSLQAMNMLVSLEGAFGCRLTLERLSIEGASIHSLMALLQKNSHPERFIYLRRNGQHTPLFLTHLKGGHFSDYLPVVDILGAEQPVIGLYPKGMAPGTLADSSIDKAAEYAAQELRHHINPVDASLVGYSFGALVAFAMARQLKLSGEPVRRLILIDPPINYIDPLRLVKLITLPLRSGEWRIAQERLNTLITYFLGIKNRPPKIDDAHLMASLTYKPQATNIPNALLILASDNPKRPVIEKQWRNLLGDKTYVLTVTGNHRSLMQDQSAFTVAKKIQLFISESK